MFNFENFRRQISQQLDDSAAKELIPVFAAELEHRMSMLESGVRDRNMALIERVAHSINSSASLYGFVELAGSARTLEAGASKKEAEKIYPCYQVVKDLADEFLEKVRDFGLELPPAPNY